MGGSWLAASSEGCSSSSGDSRYTLRNPSNVTTSPVAVKRGVRFGLVALGVAQRYCGGGFLYLGVGHLAGGGALPYQVVEALFLRCAFYGGGVHVCGAYGLVRLLRALCVCVPLARLAVLPAVELRYFLAACVYAERREVHRVGTHVGDSPALVEHLCHAHGLRHGEAELACGFLLQCGGGEGGRGRAAERLARHRAYAEGGPLAALEEGLYLGVRLEAGVKFGASLRPWSRRRSAARTPPSRGSMARS